MSVSKKAKPRQTNVKRNKQTKKPKSAKTERMSALDAAAKVLVESSIAMTCQEMITAMAEKGYWKSPAGKTPSATLYSSIAREIENHGQDARFRKVDRGRFERGK